MGRETLEIERSTFITGPNAYSVVFGVPPSSTLRARYELPSSSLSKEVDLFNSVSTEIAVVVFTR